MDKTNPSNLPQVVIEYINSVIKHLKYRNKVRTEVREELTTHFTDALAVCQSDQEELQAAKNLISEFGDIKLIGKLMRRAKKRCRPLWQTMMIRFFQCVGVSFLLLILYVGWFFTGKPQVKTNYLEVMNQRVRPVADDSRNAWPLYKQAAELYTEPAMLKGQASSADDSETGPTPLGGIETLYPEEENFDTTPRLLKSLSEQEHRILQQWLADNQKSLDLITQGNQCPYFWRIYDTGENGGNEMLSMMVPNLSVYKDLSRLICWRGLLSADQGDFNKAYTQFLESYSFGQHLRGQNTTLIEQLVAMAIEGVSTNTMRMMLDEHSDQMNASILDSARKQYQAMISGEVFTANLEGEKLFMYDEAQRCFTKSRFGKSHLYLPRLRDLGIGPNDELGLFMSYGFSVFFTHPDKEETLNEADRLYAKMEEIAAMTPASAKSRGLDINTFVEESMQDNVFLHILMPALSRVNQLAWRTRTEAEATLAILAILQYQKENGSYPDSMRILVEKDLLKAVPLDPFSDKSLVYFKTGDSFILYSVGFNLNDDGGVPGEYDNNRIKNVLRRRWADTGDAIFWPVK